MEALLNRPMPFMIEEDEQSAGLAWTAGDKQRCKEALEASLATGEIRIEHGQIIF
jgi:hypothetical protein